MSEKVKAVTQTKDEQKMADFYQNIKSINEEIQGALSFYADNMLQFDADDLSHLFTYTDADLLNTICIFNHVASNWAIKNGKLTVENVTERAGKFVKSLEESFGFNSVELTKKVLY